MTPIRDPDFFWGVANAAFQTEGELGDSDWSRWTSQPGKVFDGTKPNDTFGFYRNYEREFDTTVDLGGNAFRLSVAWERIEPSPGKYDESALDHYEKMIVALRARGIEPFVTLHHFVNPAWLEGGILNPEFPDRFADFSEKVVRRLSAAPASVKWWTTLNEPVVLTVAGYLDGQFPPGRKNDLKGAIEGLAQMVRAHIRALNRIRRLPGGKDLKIGVATHWRPFEPLRAWSPLDWITSRISENFFNRQLTRGILTGKYKISIPGAGTVRGEEKIEGGGPGADYFGINYYGRTLVKFTWRAPFVAVSEGPGVKNDLGWEIHPEGLYDSLRQVKAYGLPILITENGVADAEDSRRANALRDHIAQIDRAISEGIDVRGYFHWTLTDNFEWANGFGPKFGLCLAEGNDSKRYRPSFGVYRDLIRAHRK